MRDYRYMRAPTGLGTLWDDQGIQGSVAINCPYYGVNANREYNAVSRCNTSVPIELDGGSGTECGHWDEECMRDELMTGFATGPTILSRITIGSLQDLGYQVNYSKADSYTFSDLARECTCRPPRPRQRTLADMAHGETMQLGLGNSRQHTRVVRRRRLSDEAYRMAVEYGQTVLAQRAAAAQSRAYVDVSGTRYVGDQVISILVLEATEVYGIVVRREE
jgi:Leishmanolysin